MKLINELNEFIVLAIGTTLAIIGGLAKELSDADTDGEHAVCYGVMSNMVVGGFAGLASGLLLIEYHFSHTLVLVGCMLGGFFGVGILRALKDFFLKKLK